MIYYLSIMHLYLVVKSIFCLSSCQQTQVLIFYMEIFDINVRLDNVFHP